MPAAEARFLGVSTTSNYGTDTYAAPGVRITADAVGGGTATVTGTSASAALIAGAVALLRANDPRASTGTIVGQLHGTADAGRTLPSTGNGLWLHRRPLGSPLFRPEPVVAAPSRAVRACDYTLQG